MPRNHWLYPTLTAVAIVILVARVASTYTVFSDTIDEPYHLGAGIALVEAGRHIEGTQHPPLPRLVAALPVYLSGVRDPQSREARTIAPDLHAFEIGHRALLHSNLPYWSVLTRARAAMLVFAVISLIYVYLIGRYVGGGMVGAVAAVFFSTDPTLLGHATWITTDVAGAAGFVAAFYHGLRCIVRPTARRSAIFGIALGLGIACKFTVVLVLPALLGCHVLRRLRRRPGLVHIAVTIAMSFLSLWACYAFAVGPVRANGIPLPMPSLFAGLAETLRHSSVGHAAYLNGHISNTGWWYYFPEAIVLKSPMGSLVAFAVAMLLAWRRRLAWMALIAVAVFLGVAMASKLNIGIRHVLPAIAMLYVFVGIVLARRRWIVPLAILIALAFVETARQHPDYLAFFNSFAGGPAGGGRYLLDSNLDWGQDQARAKRWLDENARGRWITERVFGNPRLREWPREGWQLVPEGSPARGLVVISKNHLLNFYPSTYTDEFGHTRVEPEILPLLRLRPIARIGPSIGIYDLDAR